MGSEMCIRDRLVIHAVRLKPRETLTLTFTGVSLVAGINLVDRSEFILHASEEEMQKAILINPELVEPGFRPITYEKRVEPGFIDVYGRDSHGNLVVVEIKRRTAGKEAVLQLWKYVQNLKANESSSIRGILVAPRLAKGAQKMLESLNLEYRRVSPRKCAEILRREEGRKLLSYFQSESG